MMDINKMTRRLMNIARIAYKNQKSLSDLWRKAIYPSYQRWNKNAQPSRHSTLRKLSSAIIEKYDRIDPAIGQLYNFATERTGLNSFISHAIKDKFPVPSEKEMVDTINDIAEHCFPNSADIAEFTESAMKLMSINTQTKTVEKHKDHNARHMA